MVLSDLYELINGRKYKKCKEHQIRNPKTNRCINKIKQKDIKSKTKECPKDKILNIKTNRCVSINGKIGKQLVKKSSPIKVYVKKSIKSPILEQTKKPNLFKKLFYPFINRVNANIDDRIKYYTLLKQVLKIDEKRKNYCMRLYKYDTNKKPIFRIGNNIILKKQIGSDSINGIIYLSSFRDKTNKIFKYAIKLMLVNKANTLEIKILEQLTKALLEHKCPHFPILYSNLTCEKFDNFNLGSSYVKSNSNSNNITKKQIENIINYPEIIRRNYKNRNFYFMLNELANGDLNTFVIKFHKDSNLIQNALAQVYLSLLFFYKITLHMHNDTHWGNFLYHKVNPGGYFHYKILDNDYYLENLGFLWVVWDFGYAKHFDNQKLSPKNINFDLLNIIGAFDNEQYGIGFVPDIYKFDDKYTTKIGYIVYELYEKNTIIGYRYYTPKNMNDLITLILKTFVKYDIIKTTIVDKTKIVNKIPYIIDFF